MWLVKRVVWRGLVLNFHMWNKLYTMIFKFFFKTVHPFLFQICMLLVLYLSILPPYFCWGDCIFCQPVKVIWNAVSFQTQNEKYFLRTICLFFFVLYVIKIPLTDVTICYEKRLFKLSYTVMHCQQVLFFSFPLSIWLTVAWVFMYAFAIFLVSCTVVHQNCCGSCLGCTD